MKKLIAYSSISHMGFVTLGFFIFNAYGMEGGLVQMILARIRLRGAVPCAWACSTTDAFAQYRRLRRRGEQDAAFRRLMMLFAMANCGLPGPAASSRVHGDHGRD